MAQHRVRKLKEIRVGDELFRSTGFSYVKTTRDGEVEVLQIPVRSTGITEVIERARANEPKPPTKPITVTPDSPIGRALRVVQKQVVMAPDLTDPDYLKAKERYDQDLTLEILVAGVDIPILDAAGREASTREEKLAAIRALGLTVHQFQQIVADIQGMTLLSDKEREDFFGTSSESGETPTG